MADRARRYDICSSTLTQASAPVPELTAPDGNAIPATVLQPGSIAAAEVTFSRAELDQIHQVVPRASFGSSRPRPGHTRMVVRKDLQCGFHGLYTRGTYFGAGGRRCGTRH